MQPSICSVLIDIDGVLQVGGHPVAGAIDALELLRQAGLGVRFLTNTTRRTRMKLVEGLRGLGFELDASEVLTAALAARHRVESAGLRPHLLVHADLLPDWEGVETCSPNAVVVGDAGEGFHYAAMNEAFRVLMADDASPLLAMGGNRYFHDGEALSLDMGPFVAALAFASGREAEHTGKPAPAFFHSALAQLGTDAASALMIGDDLDNDIGGAAAVGLRTVLVRTGKFRPADADHPHIRPDHISADFTAAVRWLLDG